MNRALPIDLEDPRVAFAEALQSLLRTHAPYAAYNPQGYGLLAIRTPIGLKHRDGHVLRAFKERTGLEPAGGNGWSHPAQRQLYYLYERARLEQLVTDVVRWQPRSPGYRLIEAHTELTTVGRIRKDVSDPETSDRPLHLCYHDAPGADASIDALLASIGATTLYCGEVQTLRYRTVTADRTHAAFIAGHPLVRELDVESVLVLAEASPFRRGGSASAEAAAS